MNGWLELLLGYGLIIIQLVLCYLVLRLLNHPIFYSLIVKLVVPITHHLKVEPKHFQPRWNSSAPLEIYVKDLGFSVEHIFILHEIGTDRTIKYHSILGDKQHD